MKKKWINISLQFILIVFVSISINAQSHKFALSFTGGYVQDGFGGMATLDYKTNEFDFLQFNLQGSFSQLEFGDIDIPVSTYALNVGYFFDVIRNNSRTFALSLGAGGTAGYEIVNNGDETLENNQVLDISTGKAVFGAYAGLDADIFLIPTIAINLKANQVYHVNSDVGELTPYFGLGIKLIVR